MKRVLISFIAIATIAFGSFGQSPEGFTYQAVVRDAANIILNNQAVGIRISIQQGSIGGTTVYQESFAPTTNAYGLVNLEIGSGTVLSGNFTTINWSNGPFFIETAVDLSGGTSYSVMGTSQLMSVPYALHAKTAESATNDLVDDADADPNNEIQALSFSNDTLYLSNGGEVYMGAYAIDLIDDADADPANEIQSITRSGTTVSLTNGGGNFEDSVGVYSAGTGIDITNNVVSVSDICGLSVGDSYQGGIIFYLDASGCHGLIAASSDQSTGVEWYNGTFIYTDAIRNGMGAGAFNTERIITVQGEGAYAATVCSNYQGGNYGDWYLPSKYELNLMYQNIGQGNALGLGNLGAFSNDYYLSSNDEFNSVVWMVAGINFSSGFLDGLSPNSQYHVRAVRSF